jgi:hypothetical protein
VLVEFADGYRVVTLRWFIRPAAEEARKLF